MSTAADFAAWYVARRGREPFPWMERLADRFAARQLPEELVLPTGSGKSEVVLVWAWARARDPTLPRRLWIASDRRVIVDQAFEGAGVLEGDGVRVSRLRGGIALDDEDLLDAVTPQVIATTVDQLGSRLLFRAYGASPRAWPIHAGLAGADSLIVLDEAHLSPQAEDMLRAARALGADIEVMAMTATPRGGAPGFALDEADRAHPVLGPRLAARRLVEPRGSGTLAAAGAELLRGGARRVALVANTVAAARGAFEDLHAGAVRQGTDNAELHLLIGRQRPLDRDRILAGLLPRLRSGAPEPQRPLVVVTTQAIEAGADLDFDAMASEGCPVDALLQRLGRLDRLGRAGTSRCLLLKPERLAPPYGEAPFATWRWVGERAVKPAGRGGKALDLGPAAWAALRNEAPPTLRGARPEPVTLLGPHLRMLTRTSPRPAVEPDVDLLLHGPERAGGAAAVVWRRDLTREDVDEPAKADAALRLLPPSSLEACPVPVAELRRWLEGETADLDTGDVEGAWAAPQTRAVRRDRPRRPEAARVLRWRGREDGVEAVPVVALRPGDVVVLPSTLGGYDAHGWNPASAEPVPDLAEEARRARTGREVLRLAGADPDGSQLEAALRERGWPTGGPRLRAGFWSRGVVAELAPAAARPADPHREVPLADHAARVAVLAEAWARELGLDAEVLRLAGLHHDDGKADPRWQLAVRGGDLTRMGEPPLAKGRWVRSSLMPLPQGWRHEAKSLIRLGTIVLPPLAPERAELVRWLVATHHGRARPFWPRASGWAGHGLGLAEEQSRLQDRLGPWRLALHEAVLRLADRRVSRDEELAPAPGKDALAPEGADG